MSANSIVPGPTAQLVRANLLRARRVRRWTLQDVSERLAQVGHPMLATVISKVERGERRIDVDDLVAFAAVFGVEAAALLTAAPECAACHGAPPAGFACLSCGTGAAANEPTEAGGMPKRRRNAVTDAHLRAVTGVYRTATAGGEAPTMAVASAFGASHSTAARWVGMARTRGFLGPTIPGRRGGEQR